MPVISRKGKMMPESPIRKLVPYAESAKSRGVKVYHLNIGQPDIETPKVALDAIRNFNQKVIEYSHSAGILSYRKKLIEYYKNVEIDVSQMKSSMNLTVIIRTLKLKKNTSCITRFFSP